MSLFERTHTDIQQSALEVLDGGDLVAENIRKPGSDRPEMASTLNIWPHNFHVYSTERQGITDAEFLVKSPICRAAYSGYLVCVKLLWEWIDRETNVGDRNEERTIILGNAALCAMAMGHIDVLRVVLQLTGIDLACLSYLQDPNLLFLAIRWAASMPRYPRGTVREDVTKFLLSQHTFDLSVRDAYGATALVAAAARGMTQTVHMILEKQGDQVNSQDTGGRTPLSWAAEQGDNDMVQELLGHTGIQVELQDVEGFSPVDYALKS